MGVSFIPYIITLIFVGLLSLGYQHNFEYKHSQLIQEYWSFLVEGRAKMGIQTYTHLDSYSSPNCDCPTNTLTKTKGKQFFKNI